MTQSNTCFINKATQSESRDKETASSMENRIQDVKYMKIKNQNLTLH